MITIHSLTDAELLNVYQTSCRAIALARQPHSAIYSTDGQHVPLEDLILDNDRIMREVKNRLPLSYQWEIEQIKTPPPPLHGIKPGNVYKHVRFGIVHVMVVADEGTEYNCRLYVQNFYICRILLKQSTLLQHFSRLT